MIKVYISAVASLFLAGCGSNLDTVKNSTLDFNKTITVGQAFDNWKSCETKEWKSFTTDNGVNVVEFICRHKIGDYFTKLKSKTPKLEGKEPIFLDVVDSTQRFQFTLNKDDTFQVEGVEIQNTWADGSKYKDNQSQNTQLEAVYRNDLNFDPEDLNDDQAAAAATYVFTMIKPGEKFKVTTAAPESPQVAAIATPVATDSPSKGKTASCDIKSNGSNPFLGDCSFVAESNGSFTLSLPEPSKPIIGEIISVSVYVTSPGIADVSGLTVDGANSKWGTAKRSSKDKACWTGDDFEVCAR